MNKTLSLGGKFRQNNSEGKKILANRGYRFTGYKLLFVEKNCFTYSMQIKKISAYRLYADNNFKQKYHIPHLGVREGSQN